MVDLTLVIPIAGIAAFVTAGYLTRYVMKQEAGSEKIREVAEAIREGARAFMKRQYTTIAIIASALAIVFAVALGATNLVLGVKTAFAFALGSAFSAISGYIGMHISIRANQRCAAAAQSSYSAALKTALRGGAVSGLSIVAISLLGVSLLYYLYGWGVPATKADQTGVILSMVGFGFGASLVALFAQLGGGIYTKAADVGADLVGKVEKGIPEDDPRNPAVIADLVGDNVGDCAGRGADLFESTAAENVGAMILGIALYPVFGMGGILFPLLARAFGLIATIVGVFTVRCREEEDPMRALNRGYIVTSVIAMLGFAAAVYMLLRPVSTSIGAVHQGYLLGAGIIGILTAFAFVLITQYYTEYRYRPVREIAEASRTGPATNIISGLGGAFECTGLPVLTVSAALMGAYWCGKQALGDIQGAGLYGTAIATMGMLAPCAYILAMDTFGPITDNAGGIIEMSKQPEAIRRKTDRLDAVGNTTKALTKGYAIGSAAPAAFLPFRAYLDEGMKITGREIRGDLTRGPG